MKGQRSQGGSYINANGRNIEPVQLVSIYCPVFFADTSNQSQNCYTPNVVTYRHPMNPYIDTDDAHLRNAAGCLKQVTVSLRLRSFDHQIVILHVELVECCSCAVFDEHKSGKKPAEQTPKTRTSAARRSKPITRFVVVTKPEGKGNPRPDFILFGFEFCCG